jgi:hypothetical protein
MRHVALCTHTQQSTTASRELRAPSHRPYVICACAPHGHTDLASPGCPRCIASSALTSPSCSDAAAALLQGLCTPLHVPCTVCDSCEPSSTLLSRWQVRATRWAQQQYYRGRRHCAFRTRGRMPQPLAIPDGHGERPPAPSRPYEYVIRRTALRARVCLRDGTRAHDLVVLWSRRGKGGVGGAARVARRTSGVVEGPCGISGVSTAAVRRACMNPYRGGGAWCRRAA